MIEMSGPMYTGQTVPVMHRIDAINRALKAVEKHVDTKNLYIGEIISFFGTHKESYIRIKSPIQSAKDLTTDDDDNPLKTLKCSPFIDLDYESGYIACRIGTRGGWFRTTSRVYGPTNHPCERFPPGTYIEFDNSSKYESVVMVLAILYVNGYPEAIQPLKDVIFAALNTFMLMDEGSIELVGEDKVVDKILATINATDPRLINRHILLHGEPGCGKSEIVKEVIKRTPEWIHYPLGCDADTWEDFVKALDKLMKFLDKSALIVADEIDENGLTREVDREKVFKLLRVLDGVGDIGRVKFIATTNRASDLDEALLRVGRLGPAIRIEKPTEDKRRQIIAFYAGRYEGDVDVDWLCKELKDVSGADIRAAFENCIIYKEPVTTKNVLKAFKEIKSSIL